MSAIGYVPKETGPTENDRFATQVEGCKCVGVCFVMNKLFN